MLPRARLSRLWQRCAPGQQILGLGTTTHIATHDLDVADRCGRTIHTRDGALVPTDCR